MNNIFKSIGKYFFVFFISVSSLNAQWIQSTGIPQNHVVFSFTQCSGKLFAGTGVVFLEFGAMLTSSDKGITWTNVDVSQPELSAVMCLGSSGNYIYAGTYKNDLLISSNGGADWTRKAINNTPGVFQLGVSGDNVVCYTNGEGPCWISTNHGASWSITGANILKQVNAFAAFGNTFYAGAEKGLAYSTNDGLSWTLAANNGIPEDVNGQKLIYSLAYHNGKIFANSNQKIFYTADNGNNWTETNIVLSNFGRVYSMVSYNGKIYGSMYGLSDTARGVITSNNEGSNWLRINQGMPGPPSVRSLFLNNEFLLAGTYSAGVYRIPLSILTKVNNVNETAKDFSLKQNYPNPFNPETKINFTINQKGFTSLKVYDSVGKLVSTLVNNEMNKGSYEFTFSGEKLSSGIYFYKLESVGFSDTKRMILVK